MNNSKISIKTAAIATCLNIFLTIVKFILYSLSGSLAVLAEAWHSLTDIATSVLVLIAVKRSSLKAEKQRNDSNGFENGLKSKDVNGVKTVVSKFEVFISLGIGGMLMIVGGGLLRTFFKAEAYVVENALISGILFIFFSFCSHFVSRFETVIGKKEGSLGLVSDGMHARADMAASLITGIALILCSMGLNLDRWVAGIIALFILLYAFETLIHVTLFYLRDDKKDPDHSNSIDQSGTISQSNGIGQPNIVRMTALLLDKSLFGKAISKIKSFLENKLGNTPALRCFFLALRWFPVMAVFSLYGSTFVYRVDVNEEALVERFGKPVMRSNPVQPGLHVKLPWPFDKVRKRKTKRIEEIHIGNQSADRTAPLLWTRQHGMEEPFLSGDNNLFYPYITLHYRVNDIYDFLYKNRDAKALVKAVAHQITTAQFAGKKFYDIAGKERNQLEADIIETLQIRLDALQCGVEIVYLCLKDIHPPITVADSFEKVIAGFQEKQNVINQAMGIRNQILPETRGKAAQEIEQAYSYIIEKTKKTDGDAKRFELSRPETQQEKNIMMSKTYFQTMQDALKGKTKFIIDPKAGEPDIWIETKSFPDYFSEEEDDDAFHEGDEL